MDNITEGIFAIRDFWISIVKPTAAIDDLISEMPGLHFFGKILFSQFTGCLANTFLKKTGNNSYDNLLCLH